MCMGDRRDWLTVLLRRLEFPFADCLNGFLIEAHPDALGNLDVLGFPSLIDDELNQDYAVDLRFAGLLGVLRFYLEQDERVGDALGIRFVNVIGRVRTASGSNGLGPVRGIGRIPRTTEAEVAADDIARDAP